MREIRLYGSEGGGAARSPYPYQFPSDSRRLPAPLKVPLDSRFRGNDEAVVRCYSISLSR